MLKGKAAVVTGSTSGIGLCIVQTLAAKGCNVLINGFGDAQKIERFRAHLEKTHGVRALYSDADVTKPEQILQLCQLSARALGTIDILVNNAGIQHVAPIDEFPIDRWDAIIATNLSAAFHTTRALLPAMRKKGWGRIINIASAHALVASPFKSAYVAAKHGLVGLTKTVALEIAQQRITCNAICPGYVLTPLVEGQIDATAEARGIPRENVIRDIILAAQPTKEFAKPKDIAAMVVFLAGDAAAQINGAALSMDGGWTAQ